MNLAQLQYFCKLAELQHYTRAAEELYITQPTLSNSIARLEDELGVPLFERKGRNVRLTKYGREFYEHAHAALESLERGTQIAQDQAGQHGGHIEIGAVYPLQRDYLPALIREFRNRFGEGATLKVNPGYTLPLVDVLEADKYDLVFSAFVPGKDHLTFEFVLYQQLVVIAHHDNPLASREEVSLADLRGMHLITYRSGTPVGDEVAELMQGAKLVSDQFYDDEITQASMVASDEGAVGLALNTLGLSPFENLSRIRLSDVPDEYHAVYLAYKRGSYKTPAAQHFIETVRSFSWPPAQR